MEYHGLVYPVDELRPEVAADHVHYRGLHRIVVFLPRHLLDQVRPEVGCHHHHGIAEIHGAALAIGQPAILQHLQQDVEHVRVSFLHLVQQQQGIGPAAHRLGQVTALLVADVARGRPDHACHGVFLHELGHVDAHHGILAVEEKIRQGLAQLGLADTGGPEKQE